MSHLYQRAILGGTFDHFHLGHEQFLSVAFASSKHLTIGIVEQTSSNKLLSEQIEDYPTRLDTIRSYLANQDLLSKTELIPIHDIYGTSLEDPSFEAIFVTDNTKPSAELINTKRAQLGLSQLDIITIPFTNADDSDIVSSSRIRAGLINRQGHSYLKYFLRKSIYHLPAELRSTLQSPLGTAITDLRGLTKILPRAALIISVGDIVSMDLQKAGYLPSVSIVDFHTRREPVSLHEIQTYFPHIHATLTNSAGTINSEFGPLLLASLKQFKCPQIIAVNGEEDLLTLPAILLSPIDSYIIYGQYQVGMCIVKVTEELKSQAQHILSQFN